MWRHLIPCNVIQLHYNRSFYNRIFIKHFPHFSRRYLSETKDCHSNFPDRNMRIGKNNRSLHLFLTTFISFITSWKPVILLLTQQIIPQNVLFFYTEKYFFHKHANQVMIKRLPKKKHVFHFFFQQHFGKK